MYMLLGYNLWTCSSAHQYMDIILLLCSVHGMLLSGIKSAIT